MSKQAIIVPDPPVCAPWCGAEHAGPWDDVHSHRDGVEAIKWCSWTESMPTRSGTIEVSLQSAPSVNIENGQVSVYDEAPVINVEPQELTVDQAEKLARALLAMVEAAR